SRLLGAKAFGKWGPHEDLRDGYGRPHLIRTQFAEDRSGTKPLAGFVGYRGSWTFRWRSICCRGADQKRSVEIFRAADPAGRRRFWSGSGLAAGATQKTPALSRAIGRFAARYQSLML